MTPTDQPDDAARHSSLLGLEAGFLVGGGRFTLRRLLGRGGMGVVWLARDEQLEEDVALKFLPPEIRHDARALDDLRRETSRSRKLTHPNIIRIHDLYKAEHEAFISMEYVDGPNLADLQVQQPDRVFAWTYVEPLVKQLCEALDYAHSESIIHRDLKPANMMLDRRSRLKLADFGIAALVTDSVARISMRHAQSGTSTYMSPQQMDGRLPQVTDDIYALGATLYDLLTSQPPFFSGDIPHQVRSLPVQPIEERLAELGITNPVPPAVAAMIMACLAKGPADRPQSARAVAEWIGLQPATRAATADSAAQVSTTAAPAPPPQVAPPPPAPVRVTPILPDAGVEAPPDPVPTTPTISRASPRTRLAVSTAAALLLCIAGLGGWWRSHRNNHSAEATASQPAEQADEFVDAGVSEDPGKNERTLSGHLDAVKSVVFSKDGGTLASASADRTGIIWDVRTSSIRTTLAGHRAAVNAIALSDDATLVATASDDGTVRLWDALTGETKHILAGHQTNVTAVAFAPREPLIVSGDAAGRLAFCSAGAGERLRMVQAHDSGITSLAFRDSAVLASAGDKVPRLWDVVSGKLIAKVPRAGGIASALAFSANGGLLAAASSDRAVRFWDGRTLAFRRRHGWPNDIVHGMAFAPAGTHIGFATESGSIVVWELNGTRRGSWQVFRSHVGPALALALSDRDVASGGSDHYVKLTSYRRASARANSGNPAGWITLFNGHDLSGWSGDPAVWSVVDGNIHGELKRKTDAHHPSALFWKNSTVENFELEFSFRLL